MNKKILMFGGIGLLVLAGAAGGGLYFTGMLGAEEPQTEVKQDEREAGDTESVYVQLDPLSAPVFRNNRVRHNVFITLSLEVSGISARNDVVALMPRLRDAMLRDLYATPIISDETGAMDIEGVKTRMFAIAKRIVGHKVIRGVLVTRATKTG